MSIKFTIATLKKLEELYDEIGYSIRFEKGNFNSGYCIFKENKIVVVNKFLTLEGRITTLIDILPNIDFDCTVLNTETSRFYESLINFLVKK